MLTVGKYMYHTRTLRNGLGVSLLLQEHPKVERTKNGSTSFQHWDDIVWHAYLLVHHYFVLVTGFLNRKIPLSPEGSLPVPVWLFRKSKRFHPYRKWKTAHHTAWNKALRTACSAIDAKLSSVIICSRSSPKMRTTTCKTHRRAIP